MAASRRIELLHQVGLHVAVQQRFLGFLGQHGRFVEADVALLQQLGVGDQFLALRRAQRKRMRVRSWNSRTWPLEFRPTTTFSRSSCGRSKITWSRGGGAARRPARRGAAAAPPPACSTLTAVAQGGAAPRQRRAGGALITIASNAKSGACAA
jgi:hypothetical protein